MRMSEVLTPIVYQICIGGVGGFFIGYAAKKFLKIAVILAFFVFSLIFLAYANVININYGGLSDTASKFINAINPALELLTPLLSHIPFIASLIVGFLIGLEVG